MELGNGSRGAGQNPATPRKQDRRQLPAELTGLLPRKFEQGLNHVVRRRILRALDAREIGEASPAELAKQELADRSLSDVSYHMKVLLDYGMVHLARVEQARGTVRHVFVSLMEEEPVVLSLLAQTEELDALERGERSEGDAP
jgi:DNA-binding transcriptional ArsR family regulator